MQPAGVRSRLEPRAGPACVSDLSKTWLESKRTSSPPSAGPSGDKGQPPEPESGVKGSFTLPPGFAASLLTAQLGPEPPLAAAPRKERSSTVKVALPLGFAASQLHTP